MNTTPSLTTFGNTISSTNLYRLCSLIALLVALHLLPAPAFRQLLATLAVFQLAALCLDAVFTTVLRRPLQLNQLLLLRGAVSLLAMAAVVLLVQRLALPLYSLRILMLGALFIWLKALLQTAFSWFKSTGNSARGLPVIIIVATLTSMLLTGLFALAQVTPEFVLLALIVPVIAGLSYIMTLKDMQPLTTQSDEQQGATPHLLHLLGLIVVVLLHVGVIYWAAQNGSVIGIACLYVVSRLYLVGGEMKFGRLLPSQQLFLVG